MNYYRDEIDLDSLHGSGNLKLTLVDHNVLTSSQAHMDSSISRVVDHHKRERKMNPADVIEIVGSCTTLVAEIVLGVFANDPIVCRLLW
jgi:inorganic pyrophosphatase/exopolyphosphatase